MIRFFRYALAAVLGAGLALLVVNLTPDTAMIPQVVPHEYAADDPRFLRTMSGFSGGLLPDGNAVETLTNGDEIFPSMLKAIAEARSSINLETYIYWSGTIGDEFANALAAKAREGVEVRVTVDWAGSLPMEQRLIDLMTQAGVSVVRFRPIHWYTLDRVNNRTHRKLLIVDGKVAFTGGVGIADEWRGDARNVNEWRDTHYRVTGPVVPAFQAAFAENWLEATGESLRGEKFYPPQEPAGALGAQLVVSSQPNGSANMHLMFLSAIAASREHVRIGMAYFVPDDVSMAQILAARQRGVAVDILVPSENTDVPIVRKASRYFWGDLLRAGVRIFEFQPTMYHPKLLIVDDVWASFGSTNLDERSLRLNEEASLNVYGRDFARTQIDLFEADLKRSHEVSLAEWERRPLSEKVSDWFASRLRSQL